MVERSDEYIIGRLIERSRLLIAISEEIPVETKLQTQPLLKQLERALAAPADEQDTPRVRAESCAGGPLASWGLAPDDLCREHPRLIVASLSGFGQTGPWSSRPSYDIVAQAAGGFMSITGFPDTPPTRGGGSLGDFVAGLYGAIGILAALAARSRTGTGQAVDVSSQDAMFSLLDNWPAIHAATGREPARVGNRHLATAPYDAYRARDGWVVIAVATNRIFRRLVTAIGRPDLA